MGVWAKSTVQEEFEDVMKLLHARATQECGSRGAAPFFMYDNNGLQAAARPHDMGLTAGQFLRIPTHSPDFNKPVEHTFNRIKKKLLDRMYEESDTEVTPAMAQQWVDDAIAADKLESFQKDIMTLPDTWAIVAARLGEEVITSKGKTAYGCHGDYPADATYR